MAETPLPLEVRELAEKLGIHDAAAYAATEAVNLCRQNGWRYDHIELRDLSWFVAYQPPHPITIDAPPELAVLPEATAYLTAHTELRDLTWHVAYEPPTSSHETVDDHGLDRAELPEATTYLRQLEAEGELDAGDLAALEGHPLAHRVGCDASDVETAVAALTQGEGYRQGIPPGDQPHAETAARLRQLPDVADVNGASVEPPSVWMIRTTRDLDIREQTELAARLRRALPRGHVAVVMTPATTIKRQPLHVTRLPLGEHGTDQLRLEHWHELTDHDRERIHAAAHGFYKAVTSTSAAVTRATLGTNATIDNRFHMETPDVGREPVQSPAPIPYTPALAQRTTSRNIGRFCEPAWKTARAKTLFAVTPPLVGGIAGGTIGGLAEATLAQTAALSLTIAAGWLVVVAAAFAIARAVSVGRRAGGDHGASSDDDPIPGVGLNRAELDHVRHLHEEGRVLEAQRYQLDRLQARRAVEETYGR